MAIDAHSTTVPADHRALLRTWAGAVPVPTPALTAETVAMLDGLAPEPITVNALAGRNSSGDPKSGLPEKTGTPTLAEMGVEAMRGAVAGADRADEYDAAQERGEVASGRPKSLPEENTFSATVSDLVLSSKDIHVPHRGAGGVASGSIVPEENIAPATAEDIGLTRKDIHEARQIGDGEQADAAQARHMRRALEGALDHGTALLAALGLPSLVEHGFVPLDPAAIGDALDTAIATLDAMDAPGMDREDDGTAEPWLGWIDGKPVLSDSHDDREHDAADWEPMLGAPERHPAGGPWSSGRDSTDRQTHWSDGRNDPANDGEAEAGYDLPEGDDERCGSGDVDLEPSLGAPENHDQAPDQEHWAQGGYSNWSDVEIGEDESPTDKGLPFDARQANETAAREAGRQAEAMRRRKDHRTTGARDPEEVQLGNLRMVGGGIVRVMGVAYT